MTRKHPIVFGMRAIWPGQLARVELHQTRTGGDLSHISPERTHLNQFLIGNEDWRKLVAENLRCASELNFRHSYHARRWVRKRKGEAAEIKRKGPQDPWKSGRSEGPIREGILTAKKEFFEGDMPGFPCPEKVKSFRRAALRFLGDSFGATCVAAWEDQDEEAYHIHFIVVPIVETESKNSGKQRMLVPSAIPVIKSYEHGHDVAAEYFKGVGLVRGEKRAERRRQALENEQESELPADNIPCHIWRADEAVRLDEKRQEAISERADTDRRKREAEAVEKRASEAEQQLVLETVRARKADEERAARIKKEDEARAEKDRKLSKREADVEKKASMLVRTLREFSALGEQVKSAARKVGLVDHPIVQTASRAVARIKEMVGELGGSDR
ncbi:plasmid recombination protein [Roseovarius sp. S4756]|uniref:plasmid recombination protein n=1 Tax=Roseovarius maritimus TaxID=3342637 RepID=UPI003726CC37